MQVKMTVSGSKVVVESSEKEYGINPARYLDSRIDARSPDYSFIEIVINGFVKYRERVSDTKAPSRIVQLCKEWNIK